jgi:Bacterial Ig-like domain (group 3)/FG-GAP-like repeat/Viral BACON domain/S-layer homology domain
MGDRFNMMIAKRDHILPRIHIFIGFGPIFLMAALFVGLVDTAVAGVTLTASPSPAIFGAPVILTATLNPPSATGKVTFYDGSVILGTATISGGVATLRVPLNSSGPRSLVARYLGDSNNSTAASPVVLESVNSIPAYGFIPTNLNLGVPIQDFAVADFNGDGKADVVVAPNSNFISVALGNGDGTFGNAITTLAGVDGQFYSVVAADFDGDGKVDIALGNGILHNTSIFLGHGDGTFGTATTYATADGPMVVADFNRDGIPDLVIVHAHTFAILLGHGDGTFASPVEYSAGGMPSAVAVGDLNGDGKPDLVTIVPTADTQGLLIVVLLGNGDGTFSAPNSYPLYTTAPLEEFITAIVLEDVNGDGKLDLAIAGGATQGVWLCLGHGDGTFASPVQYNAAGQDFGYGVGIAAVDVNGDQKMDLVTDLELQNFRGYGLGNELQTFYGNGDGTFQPVEILNPPLTHILTKLVPVDLNGDGRVDLLSWGYDWSSNFILKLFSGGVLPELRTSATHAGNLTPGQTGATFTVVVSNPGTIATTGSITVNYQLNGFMNLDSMSGTGWTCSNNSATCSRSDSLAPGSSYPPISVTADVQAAAPAPLLTGNYAIVSGGGSETSEAFDPVNIVPLASGCSFSLTPFAVLVGYSGGPASVNITAGAGCTWTATTSAPWITITSGSGTGNGTLSFTASANSAPAQMANIAFGAQLIGVMQGGSPASVPFNDVPSSDPYFDYVSLMSSYGITAGCQASPPLYCPSSPVTRAQMAVFVVRGVDLATGTAFSYPTTADFQDVTASGPYSNFFPYVQRLSQLGITAGCQASPPLYCPDQSINQGQMAVFMIRAWMLANNLTTFTYQPTPYFTDVPSTDIFFSFIQKMKELGIWTGCTATTYCENSVVTRDQMAPMILRSMLRAP